MSRSHQITVRGPVPLAMDDCVKLQSSLESVFGHIISLNEALSKPMPVVAAHVIHNMASECQVGCLLRAQLARSTRQRPRRATI